MKTALLAGFAIAGLLGLRGAAFAATYYVSNAGDDRSDGRTQAAALGSLAEAARRVQRGDVILLQRGDVFRESVEIGVPDIKVDAYGAAGADRPVISGGVPLTGWQPYQGPIRVAETGAGVGYLFVNGRLMTIARYPNTGWLRTKVWREEVPRGEGRRGGGRTFVTCPDLAGHPRNAPGYWVGANIRWRHHSWWYETRPVVECDGAGQLTLGDRSFNDIGPFDWDEKGWGFYLDGKLEELDAPGEWCLDAQAGKAYLYPPDGVDPNEALAEGTALSTGLTVRDAVVRNVCFRHQKDAGLVIGGRCVVEHCTFQGIGRDATVSERSAGGAALQALPTVREARVRYNEFRDNLNHSIAWQQDGEAPGSSIIEHSTIVNSGTVPGYGGSGSWHAVGILIARGTNVHVRYNRITGTGYAGILLGTDGNIAEYNVIRNAMSTLNDGAGIYTNCSRSTIRHNVILDAKGGMESSGSWLNISHGIWLEFLGNYRESVVEGNTCAGCGADGIFLTNNYECIVRDNVLYGNERYQLLLTGRGESESENPAQNHLIVGNVLCAALPSQRLLYFDPRFDYGTLKANWYCAPLTAEPFVAGIGWPGTGPETGMALAAWQRDFAWADREARTRPETLEGREAGARPELFVNDGPSARSVQLSGTYLDLDGSPIAGSIELEPYSSRVLLRIGDHE